MSETQYGLTFGNIDYTIETLHETTVYSEKHIIVANIEVREDIEKNKLIELVEKLNNDGLDGVLLPYSKKEAVKLLNGLNFTLLPNKETSLLDFSGKIYQNKNLFKEKY